MHIRSDLFKFACMSQTEIRVAGYYYLSKSCCEDEQNK